MPTAPLLMVRDQITRTDLDALAAAGFGDMVKAVVDVQRRIMAVGGELHSDEDSALQQQIRTVVARLVAG